MNASCARVFASVALAGLAIVSSRAAWAELPTLPSPQFVEPTAAEIASDSDGQILFGQAVAVDGNTAMVGMPQLNPGGRVAVFDRSASGHWNRVGSIDAPNAPADALGEVIFLKGDTALLRGSLAVYVFRRLHGTWTRTATILPPQGRPIQNFGLPSSLKYDNGIVTVGALYGDDFSGTVFIYRLNTTGQVVASTQISGSDPEGISAFGYTVDLEDDTLVVGATTPSANVVLAFRRVGNQWVQVQKITAPAADAVGFGGSLAFNRDVLLIGAPGAQRENSEDTPDGHAAEGAVYVFAKSNGSYTYRTRLRPTPDQLFNYFAFGTRITTDGDRAVISAYEPPSFLFANGVAVVYERHGDQGVATALARFDDPTAVSLSGNQLLLGSPYFVDYDDNNTFHLTGFADFYTLPPIAH